MALGNLQNGQQEVFEVSYLVMELLGPEIGL